MPARGSVTNFACAREARRRTGSLALRCAPSWQLCHRSRDDRGFPAPGGEGRGGLIVGAIDETEKARARVALVGADDRGFLGSPWLP